MTIRQTAPRPQSEGTVQAVATGTKGGAGEVEAEESLLLTTVEPKENTNKRRKQTADDILIQLDGLPKKMH